MRPVFITLLALFTLFGPVLGQDTMAGFMEEDYSCIMCHTEMRSDFLEGVHSSRGIQCTDCHGGDPTKFEAEEAHTQGFSGALSKSEAVTLCLSCHGDIPQMRQFALEPVTREMFLVSRHGQRLLLEGDALAPSCSDCHGSHAILPRNDPRSMVYPARIPETCSACHSDPDRVLPGMPTSQYEEWAGSAHGVALLSNHNEEAAQCASCHGSHSALPPGVREIPNVCGKCHQLVREAYFAGPHGGERTGPDAGVPCTSCHENHATLMPPLAEISSLCQGCHDEESPEAVAGLEIQENVLRAQASGERARTAMEVLVAAGERTEDEEVRLFTVETHLQELLVQAHTLDPVLLDDLVRRVSSLATEVGERADVVSEGRWERKLMMIPLWILLAGGILLAMRKRRVLGEASSGIGGTGKPGSDGGEA